MDFRRRASIAASAAAALSLGAGLLAGTAPVAASSGPGIVVSATIFDTAEFPNQVTFRATAGMVESEVTVAREGNTVVITEDFGGPSLAYEPPTDGRVSCTSRNPSGLTDEIRCTFSGSTGNRPYLMYADFSSAPAEVTFGSDGTSPMHFTIIGSRYDDYLEGGPLMDLIAGGEGDDFIFGGGGNDIILGNEGDDVIYGDGDEDEDLRGNDFLFGGPGEDYLYGGPGNDQMYGGPGSDELDSKDGEADALVDCNDIESRGSKPNEVTYDRQLDRPIDCGVTSPPIPRSSTTMNTYTGVKVGSELKGFAASWSGTEPLAFAYRWESCTISSSLNATGCRSLAQGSLNQRGQDSLTGKPPVYTVARTDRDRYLRFVAIADNSRLNGGARQESYSPLTNLIEGPVTYEIPANFLPILGQKWSFSDSGRVAQGFRASRAAPWLTVIERGWRRSAVPKNMRKHIQSGQVFSIRVNGREVNANSRTLEVDKSRSTDVEIRSYSMLEDRKVCPATDKDLADYKRAAAGGTLSLEAVTGFLDRVKCPWAVTWDNSVGRTPVFTVSDLYLESTDDDDRELQVRIRASKPTTAAQLSIAVGAPPRDFVRQSRDHFTLSVAGAVYAFPQSARPVFTSIWTNLIGDQVRQGKRVGRLQLFVNGRLRVTQELFGNYSSIPATVMDEPGTARIVITTFADNGASRGQVFVDIPILDPSFGPLSNFVTLDGRCFNRDGSLAPNCSDRTAGDNAVRIQRILAQAQSPELMTYATHDALRHASDQLNKRFTPIIVNGSVYGSLTTSRMALGPRSPCAWWDLPCALASVITRVVNAVVKLARSAKTTPIKVKSPVVPLPAGDALGAVTAGQVALVPEAGLIGLDGASLIGLDGASLIGLDGASLIGLDAASLVGLDAASLIGLDGASLIGLDGASLAAQESARFGSAVAVPTVPLR